MAFELTTRDIAILKTLLESRISTTAHLGIFHFNGSREAAKKRIQKLKAASYIGERRSRVSDPAILFLTTKGIRLLQAEGVLQEYPQIGLANLQKRSRVSERTVDHELAVMDVKAAFHQSLASNPTLSVQEFCTWPACYEFEVDAPLVGRRTVWPDGFVRINEKEADGGTSEHSFFLEVDRSTETLDRLVHITQCYQLHHASGGYAAWRSGRRGNPAEFPFRVLVVLKTAERRNNLAERLLEAHPPILSRAWLTTFDEVIKSPCGTIWLRPRDYRHLTKITSLEPVRPPSAFSYRRNTIRDTLVDSTIAKQSLF